METKSSITEVRYKEYDSIPSVLTIEGDIKTLAKIMLYVSQLKTGKE
jgi:hypothetical protein